MIQKRRQQQKKRDKSPKYIPTIYDNQDVQWKQFQQNKGQLDVH